MNLQINTLMNMSPVQRTLLVVASLIFIGVAIYFLINWYKKTRTIDKKNKMMTMNLVVKTKPFMEYLEYKKEQQEPFNIFMVKINSLYQLEKIYPDHIVRMYLSRIAKELSVYLPFGGKVAQTEKRDTFILYYPKTNEDMYEVGERFKALASKTYQKPDMKITKGASVAFIEDTDFSLDRVSSTLASSRRNLGLTTKYDESITHDSSDFELLEDKIKQSNMLVKSWHVNKNLDGNYREIYNDVVINQTTFKQFFDKVPVVDHSWINMDAIEWLLKHHYDHHVYSAIDIPVLLSTLEKINFTEVFEHLVLANSFLMQQTILSIKITNVTYEERIIKNILMLNELGVKISLEINSLNQEVYAFIQKYHIERLEIDDALMNDESISELLYFAKVNHLEVLLKTNNKNRNMTELNITHMTGSNIVFNAENGKKRGRK